MKRSSRCARRDRPSDALDPASAGRRRARPWKSPRSETRRDRSSRRGRCRQILPTPPPCGCRWLAIFSSRAARLTAGPMQVKSSRLPPPILPYRIRPTCSATPKRNRSTASPIGYCMSRDAGAGLVGGFQHARADLLVIADIFVDRKHREQPVAHVFQDFAAMRADRGHLAVEILIENIDHGLGRQPVRQRRKAAQIGQPDRGIHGLGVAAADLAAHDPLAGAVADIGVEQHRGGAASG